MNGDPPEPVLSVTLNPAIDLELRVNKLRRGEVARADGSSRQAGGKGINVARALARMDVPAAAAVPLGGSDRAVFMDLLGDPGFTVHAIDIAGGVRTNVTLVEPGKGYVYKVNTAGPAISRPEENRILAEIEKLARGRKWVVLSGSLPPGMPNDVYSRLTRIAHDAGASVAIDCEGEALLESLREKPDIVKINRRELGATLGKPLCGLPSTLNAMRELRGRGAGLIVISDGPRPALAYDAGGELHLATPSRALSGPVFGAGDIMLAALIAGILAGKSFAMAFADAAERATEEVGRFLKS